MKIKFKYRFVDWICRNFVGYNYLDQLYVRIRKYQDEIEKVKDGSMITIEHDVLENINLDLGV